MSALLRFILVAALIAAASPCARADVVDGNGQFSAGFESNPEGAVAAARALVASGDINGAIHGLSIYVADHPRELEPARLLGDLYYRAGNLREAEWTYRTILTQFPYDRETHNRLGAVYAAENRVDDAIAEYNKSLPGTDSIGSLVQLHQRRGDLQAYRDQVERTAKLYPTDPDAQHEFGEVLYALHDDALALQYFQRELDESPASLFGLNSEAKIYMDEDDYPAAVTLLQRCLRIDPANYSCIVNLAAADLEQQRNDEATALLTHARALRPEMPEALVNLGYIQDEQGNWKGAIALYLKALAVSPFSVDAYHNLGYDYYQHRLFDLAESVLLKGLTVSPNDGPLHYILGETYAEQGKNAMAVAQFTAAKSSGDPGLTSLANKRIAQLGSTGLVH